MTRNKFVKSLMAAGFQRNKANEMADIVVQNSVSYQSAIMAVHGFSDLIKIIIPALGGVLVSLGEALKEVKL